MAAGEIWLQQRRSLRFKVLTLATAVSPALLAERRSSRGFASLRPEGRRTPLHQLEELELTRARLKKCSACGARILRRPKFLSLADRYASAWIGDNMDQERACLLVAQWNLAGVNHNAFEFEQPLPASPGSVVEGPALFFGHRMSCMVQEAIRGPAKGEDPKKALGLLTAYHLLQPLSHLAVSYPFAGKLSKLAPRTTMQEFLQSCVDGNTGLSRADLMFGKRTWSLMKLTADNAGPLIRMCRSGDIVGFWKTWLDGILGEYPEASEKAEEALALVIAEAFFFHCAMQICASEMKEGTMGDIDRLAVSLAAHCTSMEVSPSAKALGVARVLHIARRHYCPDVFSLQEFNSDWLLDPGFEAFWTSMQSEYDLIRPTIIRNPSMVTCLFIRKQNSDDTAGPLTMDSALTLKASSLLCSENFRNEHLRKAFASAFSLERQGAVMLDRAISNATGFLDRKAAFAVCHVNRKGKANKTKAARAAAVTMKVPAGEKAKKGVAHASSDGSDNRATVLAFKTLADLLNLDLLMAMDANSAADFGERKAGGAASQSEFFDFIHEIGVRHCYEHHGSKVTDPQTFHTVRKSRTFFQCQMKKAGKPDTSTKDFVLGAGGFTAGSIRGVRINKPSGMSSPDEQAARCNSLPSEDVVWRGDVCMPTIDFGSDHALVLAVA
ncbi:unnamed protein product, partial [Polarella glacialis]